MFLGFLGNINLSIFLTMSHWQQRAKLLTGENTSYKLIAHTNFDVNHMHQSDNIVKYTKHAASKI